MSRIQSGGCDEYLQAYNSTIAYPRHKWEEGKVYHGPTVNVAWVHDMTKEGGKDYKVGVDPMEILVSEMVGLPVINTRVGITTGYEMTKGKTSKELV